MDDLFKIAKVPGERRWKALLVSQSGQSTIEFALTMILLIAFIFFYFQISMIFAFGSFAHYATFMSARAYLSSGPTLQDQQSRARSVMLHLVKKGEGQSGDRMPWLAKGIGDGDPVGVQIGPSAQFKDADSTFSWMQGVRYTFRSKLFLLPFAGAGKGMSQGPGTSNAGGPPNTVTLTSESWLGRDPASDECQGLLGKGGAQGGQGGGQTGWAFDNGC
jgi:hypothetical protein